MFSIEESDVIGLTRFLGHGVGVFQFLLGSGQSGSPFADHPANADGILPLALPLFLSLFPVEKDNKKRLYLNGVYGHCMYSGYSGIVVSTPD